MTEDASPENLRKFLESDDPALVRMGIAMAKGAGVEVTVKDLERFLKSEDGEVCNSRTGVMLADEAGVGDEAMEMLCEVLGDEDKDVRRNAAYALENIGDERAVEPLIEALGDEKYMVREYVVGALAKLVKIGDTRAVEPLIEVLDEENGIGEERVYAAEALGRIGDTRAVEPLIEALEVAEVGHCDLCEAAAEALGRIGDTRAVEPLIEVFNVVGVFDDFDHTYAYYFRICAAEALGEIGDTRAVKPLIEVLENEERLYGTDPLIAQNLPHVREAAKAALKKLGHEVE